MPRFEYTAVDPTSGETKSGRLDAGSLTEAIADLESRGLDVQSIGPPSSDRTEDLSEPSQRKLHHLVEQSLEIREDIIPVLEAFREEIPQTVFRSRLETLIRKLQGESSATELIDQFPDWIPTLIGIHHGNSSTQSMNIGLEHATQRSDQQAYRWRAIMYPLIVLSIGVSVLITVLWFIVPEFTRMFEEFAILLPTPTLSLIWLSRRLQENPLAFAAGTAGIVLVFGALTWAIIHEWSVFRFLHLFLGRRRGKLSAIAMLAGDLSEMLRVGVPVHEALRVLSAGCDSPSIRPAIDDLATHIHAGGGPLPKSSAASLLPGDILTAITSANATLLSELSRLYMDRFWAMKQGPGGALSQWAIVVVGIIIGWVIVALFFPVISLIDSLS